jgi:demethylmenaquinone methyltransferase/2-methoxy-6-polyprenyl-1,4-benzoquinol methylase
MILELTTPEKFPMKQAYKIYSKLVIPTIGRFISKDKIAYKYLPATIKAFVQGRQMADILSQTGFCNVQYKTYTFGICTMYLAEKTV